MNDQERKEYFEKIDREIKDYYIPYHCPHCGEEIPPFHFKTAFQFFTEQEDHIGGLEKECQKCKKTYLMTLKLTPVTKNMDCSNLIPEKKLRSLWEEKEAIWPNIYNRQER